MSIGELARHAGVGIQTIRYYERRGLLPEPLRSEAGHRRYPLEQLRRLRFILRAKALSFSLAEIARLLELSTRSPIPQVEVEALLSAKRADVEQRLAELQRVHGQLQHIAAEAANRTIADCPLLRVLTQPEDGMDSAGSPGD